MFIRSIFAAFVAAACPVSPLAIDLVPRNETAITVRLSATGNTAINAVITNTGDDTISLLNLNSLLDPDPVQKVEIYKDGMNPVPSNYVTNLTPYIYIQAAFFHSKEFPHSTSCLTSQKANLPP